MNDTEHNKNPVQMQLTWARNKKNRKKYSGCDTDRGGGGSGDYFIANTTDKKRNPVELLGNHPYK